MFSYLFSILLNILLTYGVSCVIMFVLAYILTYKEYPEMTYNRLEMLLYFATTWPSYILELILPVLIYKFGELLVLLGFYGAGIVTSAIFTPSINCSEPN